MDHETAAGDAQSGREAAIVLQLARPILDEAYDALVTNAIAAYRGGRLDASPHLAVAFVAKLDALIGFREELESRISIGESAFAVLAEARDK